MNKQKQKSNIEEVDADILSLIEFDLNEALKDLIYNIKSVKNDVDKIKEYLKI